MTKRTKVASVPVPAPTAMTLGDALTRICKEHGCTELQISARPSQQISISLSCIEAPRALDTAEKEKLVPFSTLDKPAYQLVVPHGSAPDGKLLLVAFVADYKRRVVPDGDLTSVRVLIVQVCEPEAKKRAARRPRSASDLVFSQRMHEEAEEQALLN